MRTPDEKKTMERIAIRYANAYAMDYVPRKGHDNPYWDVRDGCEAPMEQCTDNCGYRNVCQLRKLRNICYNSISEFSQCVMPSEEKGGEQ